MSVFFLLCWVVYSDGSYATYGTSRPSLSGVHSGGYFARAANVLQYYPHDPAQVDDLFKRSIKKSPANWNTVVAYFQFLRDRNCCIEQSTQLIRSILRRNPATMRLYLSAVAFFFETGQKEEAFHYFQKVANMEPRTLRDLIAIAGRNDITVPELIRITPKTPEGLGLLATYLAKRGLTYKEEWLRIVQELHSFPVEPQQRLMTAEQAVRMGEIELAKEYAELALKYPETHANAKRILAKLSKRKKFR